MSCLLFHGPGARVDALSWAYQSGRLLEDPIGDTGLKVDDARKVVELLMSTPVGSEKGVLVVGPMDSANRKSSDVLLKSIEEYNAQVVEPILWAYDLGGVSKTIRSRCIDRWCPKNEEADPDDELVAAGYDLVYASLEGESWRVPSIVKKYKGREGDLMRSIVDALQDGKRHRELWQRLRKVALDPNPTALGIIVALMSES